MKRYGVFPFAVFFGAFLLFQIQPLIGKYFLPWFGGASAVWTTCLMFFQLLLFGGYAYAHFLQRFAPRQQVRMHLTLLAITLLGGILFYFIWGSPILPSVNWRPDQGCWPTWNIFRLLLISIGASYFLLSTSTSLLQAWFHRAEPSQSPYVFYIVSNAASILALLSYPFLIEPMFSLKVQALLWSCGFLVYVILCLLASRRVWPILTVEEDGAPINDEGRPRWKNYVSWVVLAACGVLTLMAVTNQMTQDIPPVPFLWILPLILYLSTYIIAFVDRFCRWQNYYIVLMLCAGVTAWYLIDKGTTLGIGKQVAGYGFILFSICLFCHNALYRLKPRPHYLTSFYLCISLGGVLGGIFVGIIAPQLFRQYWEYQLCLVLAAVLVVVSIYSDRRSAFYSERHAMWLAVIVLAFFVSHEAVKDKARAVYTGRNFFGSIRVNRQMGAFYKGQRSKGDVAVYSLVHGRTVHGRQIHHPSLYTRTTTYFTEKSGVGLAILNHPKRLAGKPMKVGVIGMGIGVLSAYGRAGDLYRFYEIDPNVIELAQDSPWFSYLRDSRAEIQIAEGDGRISLENELGTGSAQYDILVVDVFSGDHIPIHMLTLEAFDIYLKTLAGDGVIAVHISNNNLNLLPVLVQVKNNLDLHAVFVRSRAEGGVSENADWVLLSRNEKFMQQAAISRADSLGNLSVRTIRPWTDDYSNLLAVLK